MRGPVGRRRTWPKSSGCSEKGVGRRAVLVQATVTVSDDVLQTSIHSILRITHYRSTPLSYRRSRCACPKALRPSPLTGQQRLGLTAQHTTAQLRFPTILRQAASRPFAQHLSTPHTAAPHCLTGCAVALSELRRHTPTQWPLWLKSAVYRLLNFTPSHLSHHTRPTPSP